MTAQEFEARLLDWVRQQPDVEALIQIGSRVQVGANVDEWSDWDYHLIVSDPTCYRNTRWVAAVAQCWSVYLEQTERGVAKLSVVMAGGREADFVLLSGWQMKLLYWAMAHPGMRRLYPRSLVRGIYNTRLFVRPGYRILAGGAVWRRRLAALAVDWPVRPYTDEDFKECLAGFWRYAVWMHKKNARGELRAALRCLYRELAERRMALLEEEARIAGKAAKPEARKAERWLDPRRLAQTAIESTPDQRSLARALLAEIALFEEVSQGVAQSQGFPLPDYQPLAAWLRTELVQLAQTAVATSGK